MSKQKGTRDGKLPAKPIMVYPATVEDRELLEAAARDNGRKLSPFIMHTMMRVVKAWQTKPA
jgi:uncharacterized protein (DUF1778 family)